MSWLFTHVDPALLLNIFGLSVLLLLGGAVLVAGLLFLFLKFSGALLRKVTRPRHVEGEASEVPEAVAEILKRDMPRTRAGQFLDGLRTPLDGLRIMNAYPGSELWRYGIAPAVCSLFVTSVVLAGIVAVIGSVAPSIHREFGHTWSDHFYEGGVFLLIIGLSGGAAFLAWLLLQTIFGGYFFSLLVLQVERKIGTPDDQLHEPPILIQVRESIIDVVCISLIFLCLLAMNIVPLFGSIIAVAGAGYLNSLFAGFEFLDYPLVARGVRRKERRRFQKQNRWSTLGLGTFVICVMLIPGIGALLLCTAAAGAVALHHRLAGSDIND